jgi:hypothetical protein
LENHALLQLNKKKNNFILQLDSVLVHFPHIVHDCLNANFSGRRRGRGGTIMWPPHSPDHMPLDFFLWGYVKDQVYSQRMNTLGKLKHRSLQ